MRTTIELRDDLRARLLDLAARRGEKGFSNLVMEAVEAYLARAESGGAARERALQAEGCLEADDAADLRERTLELRERWR